MDKATDQPDGLVNFNILGMNVAVTSLEVASGQVLELSNTSSGSYVCAANVHMCMEAYRDHDFQSVVNNAVLVVPDGKPLMWWMRALGEKRAQQVRGPDLFLDVCDKAGKNGTPVALYGGSPDVLKHLQAYLTRHYPDLIVTCAISPPYRPLSEKEQNVDLEKIRSSGARILFVGLGCPKQENWMASYYQKLDVVMLGVGAAFDFYSGEKKVAPEWMRKVGLEWLYRLLSEPGRLWRRYLYNNPVFIYQFLKAFIGKYLNMAHRNKSS